MGEGIGWNSTEIPEEFVDFQENALNGKIFEKLLRKWDEFWRKNNRKIQDWGEDVKKIEKLNFSKKNIFFLEKLLWFLKIYKKKSKI